MDKLRVLFLVPDLKVASGVSSFAMNYYRKIDKEKVHIDFLSYGDISEMYRNEVEKNESVVFYTPITGDLFAHCKKCKKIIQNGNYDIVHDNTLVFSLPTMYYAMKYNVKVRVLHSHASQLGETKFRAFLNSMFISMLRSTATHNLACSTLAGTTMFKRRQFDLLCDVIQTDKFIYNDKIRNKIRKEQNVGDKIVIGTVGRLANAKNPFFAMKVIEKILNKYNNVEYWWIGQGEMSSAVQKYVQECGLSERIKLLGSKDNVVDYYNAFDVYFMPSKFEGLGMAAIEAQAMGLPCVISNRFIEDVDYTDLVTRVAFESDIDAWISAIEKSMKFKRERQRYNDVLKKSMFSDDNAGKRLTKYYFECAGRTVQ